MKIFSPDDLKSHYPGKFDAWKFAKNGRGEWVGYFKKETGSIVSLMNEKGEEYPDFKKRELESTGGWGLSIWAKGISDSDNAFKKQKDDPIHKQDGENK